MIRTAMLTAATLLLAPLPALAQSQAELDTRHDRALAAGYKALMLCGAIANAERAGATRTPESVMEWELAGIQPPQNAIVGELPHRILRADYGTGVLTHVEVDWAQDMPPRIAWHEEAGGCSVGPVGATEPPLRETLPWAGPDAMMMWHERIPDAALGAVTERAFASGYGEDSRTTAFIVARGTGNGIYWHYAPGFDPFTPQRTWSVAKSIAATLVGAAVYRGEADVSASAGLGEGEADPRRAITIDHALRMASGRYSDTPGNRTDALYFGGATVDEVVVDWPLIRAPGTQFRYANNDTLAAVQAIESTFADHPPAELFSTLGMYNTVAETDWQGNYVLSSQVWATAPDLVRLGQLHLNDGLLADGTRILPEGWVDYISTPSGPQPGGALGYGAGWWLMNNSEGVPPDTFAAQGNRGQYIVVVPSRDVVIVRRGEDPAGGSGFDITAFTRDVLAALEE
jgi:CubicO group peptidase (beta-lactamase class C family)